MATTDEELAHTATAPGASKPRTPADPVGEALGRYRLEHMLGEGGMGVVHAAFDPDLERRVALKVLRTTTGGEEARQRLLREARAMARLTHANVVAVHEVGTAGDRDYVAMELIDGQTLADWLDTKPRRRVADITAAFVAAGRGVAAAHAAGLVHRDFKPRNVLRGRDGRIVVTDFGLARGVEASKEQLSLETTLPLRDGKITDSTPSSLSGLTQTGSVLGTPAYMAPEQWSGETVGPAADQFAFCVALWEALTGERPYRGDTIEALKERLKHGPADLDASKLPRALRRSLLRGLEPDAAKRWPSMDALLAAITRHQRGPSFVIAGAGTALIAVGVAFLVLRGTAGPTCESPARDPATVWPAALPPIHAKFGAEFTRDLATWHDVRAQACRDPGEHGSSVRSCLDGVLARLELARLATERVTGELPDDTLAETFVDPTLCANTPPPRLAVTATPDMIAALAMLLDSERKTPAATEQAAKQLATKPGIEPCARAVALRAFVELSHDVPANESAIADAVAAADACGDDRLRADVLLDAAPLESEQPTIGPKGIAALQRAKIAVDRVPQTDLVGRFDLQRADAAVEQSNWAEAFAATKHALDGFAARHRIRDQQLAQAEDIEIRFARNQAGDIEAARAAIATLEPMAEARHDTNLVRSLAFSDAYARLFLGDLAGAHAELMRLWEKPRSHTPGVPIEGTVVDVDGKPAAGALVAVSGVLFADSLGALPFGDTSSFATTTADAAGHFAFADAPAIGAVMGQLGTHRAHVLAAPHVHLVLGPTRTITGRAELGSVPRTKTFVVLAPDNQHDLYREMTTLTADGTFEIDRALPGKGSIGVTVWDQQRTGKVDFTPVPAGTTPITGLRLGVGASGRTLEVIVRSVMTTPLDGAQVLLFAGRRTIKTVDQLDVMKGHGMQMQFARPIIGEAVPQDVRPNVKAGDLISHFADVVADEVTVCVIGLNGNLSDPEFSRKLQAHVHELQLKCQVAAASDKVLVIEAPPQRRFD